MISLEDLQVNDSVRGIMPGCLVTVTGIKWIGTTALELTYKDPGGRVNNTLLYRQDGPGLEVVRQGRPWCFDGDGSLFRLVSEAHRIRLAYLFDPVLAVHTSLIDPLPHQITAVYECMLHKQPLRLLLADDPGAGKTIMAGLLVKELMIRGDLQRCLVVCPGSLAEQWQDELYGRFQLPFEILTNEKLQTARSGNWFKENHLVIARLDKLSRDQGIQDLLADPECDWDLVICDEAHKMSAAFYGGEVKYTKRHKLGQLVSTLTRHFLLMTATPHNGKEEEFQLFLSLLDRDRFEGRFRDGVHTVDVSDLMRRMVKEDLYKFDCTPLFPERRANTVAYALSGKETELYGEVTGYVREEFNRAEAIQDSGRAGTVGFALTILQRRLASSPEAIYRSLHRRRERLEGRLQGLEQIQQGGQLSIPWLEPEDIEDLEDAYHELEEQDDILDQATAARTIGELKAELDTLNRLENLARAVRDSGEDRKWQELDKLLREIFCQGASRAQKLVIFTEHRDTLSYLERRIKTFLGEDRCVTIHGSKGRRERLKIQESFMHDPLVQVLVATDAAGEGINLQRAHLMVNYDLPWNPNRLEQRFGRIHRIGQAEVCHLWNLVSEGTREGDVYKTLLDKLEEARRALGGKVFDVLGKLQFEGRPLRELLLEAVRYGEQPGVRSRHTQVLEGAFDQEKVKKLLEEQSLAREVMDTRAVHRVREEMERAEARRLQPHYIESFFLEAFRILGGKAGEREKRRYEITHVPAEIRGRGSHAGIGGPALPRYERVTFDKGLIKVQGKPEAAFICPGHPLLDATMGLVLERNRDLLRRGSLLVDDKDQGVTPRVIFYLEHTVRDATPTPGGEGRPASRRMLYIELGEGGQARHLQYAPYLDYRPLGAGEPGLGTLLALPQLAWVTRGLEEKAMEHAILEVVPRHLEEVKSRRQGWVDKTRAAVKERLTKEINYWDHRSAELLAQEQAGKPNAQLNSQGARRRADGLQERLEQRMGRLDREAQVTPSPPVVLGGLIVIPAGLLRELQGQPPARPGVDRQAAAARARQAVMEVERGLGFEPVDRETERLGYDLESRDPQTGRLRFIEVKGRVTGAETLTVTRNEILYSLNKPDDFILAIVEFDGADSHTVHYLRQPFQREPDFGVTSVNYSFKELLNRAGRPC